jgi:hypothetical protein
VSLRAAIYAAICFTTSLRLVVGSISRETTVAIAEPVRNIISRSLIKPLASAEDLNLVPNVAETMTKMEQTIEGTVSCGNLDLIVLMSQIRKKSHTPQTALWEEL